MRGCLGSLEVVVWLEFQADVVYGRMIGQLCVRTGYLVLCGDFIIVSLSYQAIWAMYSYRL